MQLRRIMPSIGHGAFYIEVFENKSFVAVYDCGSDNKKELAQAIEKLDVDKIDVLFISHFDDDHVNGISKLCEQCKISYVILPDLYDSALLYLTEAIVKESSMDVLQLIINPEEFFHSRGNEETEIVFVLPYGQEMRDVEHRVSQIHSGSDAMGVVATNDVCLKWKYVLHNSGFSAYGSMIKIEIENMLRNNFGQTAIDFQWIIKNMDRLRKPLKQIFVKYGGGHKGDKSLSNQNSLVVYSSPCMDCFSYATYNYLHKELRVYHKPGFLYCGDYNMLDSTLYQEFKNTIGDYEQQCGGVQIPHHGSNNNYNTDLIDEQRFGLVSVGTRGKHGGKFPHADVADDVLKKSVLCQITNQSWTYLIQDLLIKF